MNNRSLVEIVSLEDLVPEDHLLRKIDAAVDFSKIYEPVLEMLSGPERKSYDAFSRIRLVDVPVPLPEQVHAMVTGEATVSDSETTP